MLTINTRDGAYLCPDCEVAGHGTTCWGCDRPVTHDRGGPQVLSAPTNAHYPIHLDPAQLLNRLAHIQRGLPC